MATSMLALPAGAPAQGAEARKGILPLAVSVAGASALMVMGGLVGAYLVLKSAASEWPVAETFDNYTSVTITLTVFMAMVTVEWAAYAIRKIYRGQALFAFAVTIGLAVAHLNGLAYLINGFEFGVADSPYATVVYGLTLVPFLLGVVGTAAVALVGARAVGHQLAPDNYALMRAAAIAWHVASIAWVIAYYTVYITK